MILSAPTDMTKIPPQVLEMLQIHNIPPEKAPRDLFLPWNVYIHEFVPGTFSSNPHCHSIEDEMALVLSGKARYWLQGEEPEKILKTGDCVGWRSGTGVCHSLLNDADGPNGEGK
jgi:mannose-6-phosphate isomerase-like protein (cupin superfamily)